MAKAKVAVANDIGLETVASVQQRLQVDGQWLQPIERGFRWWAGPLAQSVWAEPLFDDAGIVVTRVHIQTDLLRGFRGDEKQDAVLALVMKNATVGGPLAHASESHRIGLASCVWVNGSNMTWAPQVAAWAASIQAAEAHILGSNLADLTDAEADLSEHPTSGKRVQLDDMLGIIRGAIHPAGAAPSAFAGDEMLSVLGSLQEPPCVLATGSGEGLSAEFPFHESTSLLQLLTAVENPRMGRGVLTLLSVPGGENSVKGALEMNAREVRTPMPHAPRSHFLGSWTPSQHALTFASFLPNAMHRRGILQNLTFGHMNRAKWVAEAVFGDDWSRSYAVALETKRQQLATLARRAPREPAPKAKPPRKKRRS